MSGLSHTPVRWDGALVQLCLGIGLARHPLQAALANHSAVPESTGGAFSEPAPSSLPSPPSFSLISPHRRFLTTTVVDRVFTFFLCLFTASGLILNHSFSEIRHVLYCVFFPSPDQANSYTVFTPSSNRQLGHIDDTNQRNIRLHWTAFTLPAKPLLPCVEPTGITFF